MDNISILPWIKQYYHIVQTFNPALQHDCYYLSKVTEEDREKLRRFLEYLFETLDMPRIVCSRNFSVLQR